MGKRRLFCRLTALLLVLFLLPVAGAKADLMGEARTMLQMINDFRTGGDAWYWNSDNVTFTQRRNLSRLQYDDELEATALVRAQEIARNFDHTRPDGTDCFTAFPAGRDYMAENIAYGYPTAQQAFEGFLEENEDYAGQGHRRVMLLNTVTRVGIAAVEVGGTRYWVQEFSSEPKAAAAAPANTSGKAGWQQSGGKWYYWKNDGTLVKGWLKDGGKWYYMGQDGAMVTGWQEDGGKWYFFSSSGAMQTGWIKSNNKWFFMNTSGEMITGWKKDGGKWYYLGKDGAMATGWVTDGGKKYYMDGSGAMVSGWKRIGGKWYYFNNSGAMVTGWLKLNKKWYYMDASGVMVTGTVKIDGSTEVFNADGSWSHTQLQDYDTPLSTEHWMVRIFKAMLQYVKQLLHIR